MCMKKLKAFGATTYQVINVKYGEAGQHREAGHMAMVVNKGNS